MSKGKLTDKEVANSKSEKIMNTVAVRCSFYRANPQRFAKDCLNLNLKPFQQLLLFLMVRCTGFTFIAARGIGKSFLTAVFCVITCILWPESKVCIACKVRTQSINILDEKIMKEIYPNSPLLRSEIKKWEINADTVGTTLKSLSMYLRAAKSDAENAGIEVDGMANSVSELRSELKSLTGVDIMLDSKNFKSTYQVMKELSQVWSGLSDITQANVTEMIDGKRNANAVSAILNNFDVAESAMESAANSANVAWEENEKYLDSIQGRLAQLDASFQVLSQDVLSSGLLKTGVSFLTSIVKLLDKIINLTGALPAGLGIAAFAGQLGEPKMTGFMIVPSNTPGGDTEQARCSFYWRSTAREYLVKPTNMVA